MYPLYIQEVFVQEIKLSFQKWLAEEVKIFAQRPTSNHRPQIYWSADSGNVGSSMICNYVYQTFFVMEIMKVFSHFMYLARHHNLPLSFICSYIAHIYFEGFFIRKKVQKHWSLTSFIGTKRGPIKKKYLLNLTLA